MLSLGPLLVLRMMTTKNWHAEDSAAIVLGIFMKPYIVY